MNKTTRHSLVAFCAALLLAPLAALDAADTPVKSKAGAKTKAPTGTEAKSPAQPRPTLANVAYGAHERQVLDFYKAESSQPTPLLFFIHGGSWLAGDKASVPQLDKYLAAGISVVSINYRYSTQAQTAGVKPPVEWPLHDAARALQFVRSKASEWNIDKARIGASGGSAGACSSLWLAFHDDLADPKSADPVARQSTRLWCAAVVGAQTTLDPKQMKDWTPNSYYGGHAFGFMPDPKDTKTGDTPFARFLAARDQVLPWIKQYSPYEHVSADDPPIYLIYFDPPALGQNQRDPTHTANFGVKLQERCKSVGVQCELVYPGAPDVKHPQVHDYLVEKLKAGGAREEEGLVLFVATHGSDAWSGRLPAPNASHSDGPFATLHRARDAIRQLKQRGPLPKGGVAVELAGGIYPLTQPLELTQQDSGTEEAPIVYRGRKGTEVRFIGGKLVTDWRPVTDPAVLARLDEKARGHVLQSDLKAQGVTDLGEMKSGSSWGQSEPGLELFFQDQPMTLARWPNQGFARMVDQLGPTPVDVRGTKGCREGIFAYEGDRPKRWSGEKDIMLHGYWFWDWADQRLKVESIDTEKRVITLEAKPQHDFGFRKGQWYYAYNLLAELDQPGEWYLDRQSGILYFWPPSAIATGKPMISVLPNLVTMKDVSFVTLRRLTLETCRGTAVTISGGTKTRIVGCVIRNTGGWAVSLSGKDSGVTGCDLYNLAEGGVSISGGDRRTLTPAGLYVDNCHLYRFGRWNPICKPGVQVDGVGNRVTHNLFHDAPHMAVMWGGNDHTFEFNEFHSVVYGANDAGIMYAGYNPAMRGHVIRYNYFHDVYGHEGRGCNGIYLDDMFCSATIFGNVFYRVPRAAFIGGGHDNAVENNIFVECTPALHVDARMMGWASASVPLMKQRLEEVPYKDEPWRSRYPQLLRYLEGNYARPRGNLVARNICWGGTWDEVEAQAKPGVTFTDNLTAQDPHFVDAAHRDFRLREDSPAWKLGFQRIPIEKIGLYASDDRASWPVRHEVRPRPAAAAPGK